MSSRDLYNNIGLVAAVAPAVLSATAVGSIVDLAGFESATVVINTGAIVASGNFTPKLEESDNGTDFTAVVAADLIGSFPSALTASSVTKVGYKGGSRYIRPTLTLNSGTSIAAGVLIIKGHPKSAPSA